MNIISFIKNNYILIGIISIGAILRFYKLDFQSVWFDEIHTMNEANPNFSFSDIHSEILAHEQMPPIYFYTVNILFKIFGYTPFIARLYSAVIGVFGIYAIYLLGKEMFNKRVGIIAAAITSVNYFQLYYSQEARPYIFLFLFSTLSFCYLIRYIKAPTMKNAMLYGTIAAFMLYSHFFGLFILFAQYVVLTFFFLLSRDKSNFFKRSIVSGLVTVVLFIPAMKIFIGISKMHKFHLPEPAIDIFTKFFKDFFGNSEFVLTMVSFLIVFYFIRLAKQKEIAVTYDSIVENKTIFSFVILAPVIVIAILIPLIRSYLVVPMLENRYFMALLPPIIILLAVAIYEFKSRIIQIGFISIFLIFSVTDIVVAKKYYHSVIKSEWRELSYFVLDNIKKDEPVVSRLSWHVSYLLKNDNMKINMIDKNLEDYVVEMSQNPSIKKAFWYVDGHHDRAVGYELSILSQAYMDDNYIEDNSLQLFQAWAKHFVPAVPVAFDVSKYNLMSDKNGDEINFNAEYFSVDANQLNMSGWAYLIDSDSSQSKIEIVLVDDGKASKIATQKIKREDVTAYFKSELDLNNSGFSLKMKMTNIQNGNYRVGIMVENKETKKRGLVLTDKTFSKQ